MSKEIRTARARLAINTRHHPDEDHTDLRRDLKTANLAAYVERVINEAPPLTSDQIDRVAVLLRGSK